jgi:hypothetical protein
MFRIYTQVMVFNASNLSSFKEDFYSNGRKMQIETPTF